MDFKKQANTILYSAYKKAFNSEESYCQHKSFIDFVLDNNHLTYKYVLFTALLAKSTDSNINPLCLQKKSTLTGAYDARSLCHKVIVPFEMTTLRKVLGGSNEPFLNKPARFTELNKSNAVRRGKDQEILFSLCDNLPLIKSSSVAFECLVYFLQKLLYQIDINVKEQTFYIPPENAIPSKIINFIEKVLEQSFEGETLTLMVAGIYHLRYLNSNTIVEVHPVNQAGKSGREISDLDIYKDNKLLCANELKDKLYTETDVRFAADKVINAGGTKMLFIEGPRGVAKGDFAKLLISEYDAKHFMLDIVPYDMFFRIVISSIDSIDIYEFIKFIMYTAHNTKFKTQTIKYIDEMARLYLNLSR